jgi:hypothetical protein
MNSSENQFHPQRRSRWLLWVGGVVAVLVFAIVLGVLYLHRPRPEVEQALARLRSLGYPTSLKELADQAPIVRDEDNSCQAALDFAGLLQKGSGDRVPFVSRGRSEVIRGEPWPQETLKAAREYVEQNAEAFAFAPQILSRTQGASELQYSKGFEMMLPQLAEFKSVAQALAARGGLAIEEGRPSDAVRDILTILNLGHGLDEQPLLLIQLVRIAIQDIAFKATEQLINRVEVPDTDLATLQKAFIRAAAVQRLDRCLAAELAFGLDFYGSPAKLAGLGLTGNASARSGVMNAGISIYSALGLIKMERATHIRFMSEFIEISRLPSWDRPKPMAQWDAAVQQLRARRRPGTFIVLMLLPALVNAAEKESVHRAQMQCAATAIALERYRLAHGGNRPDTLQALVPNWLEAAALDPFDGQPLRYQNLTGGFAIYSIGPNLKDDHGLERLKGRSGNDHDIPFVVER